MKGLCDEMMSNQRPERSEGVNFTCVREIVLQASGA
jgi:hypothetical protein